MRGAFRKRVEVSVQASVPFALITTSLIQNPPQKRTLLIATNATQVDFGIEEFIIQLMRLVHVFSEMPPQVVYLSAHIRFGVSLVTSPHVLRRMTSSRVASIRHSCQRFWNIQ